jgi:hypothetical protein
VTIGIIVPTLVAHASEEQKQQECNAGAQRYAVPARCFLDSS